MTMTISGASGVTFPNSSTSAVGGVGDGQTWQNVLASRANNTTYTNSTGKPIVVNIGVTNNTASQAKAFVDGVEVARMYNGNAVAVFQGCSFIVPNGSTYNTTGVTAFQIWAELR